MKGFREYLKKLKDIDDLIEIDTEVDPVIEIAKIQKKYANKKTVLFNKIKGYDIPVVNNIFHKRENIALALETDLAGLKDKILFSVKNPVDTILVKDAPVQEIVITKDINPLDDLPIPQHYLKDNGKYITAGVILAADPVTGIRNISFARMKVNNNNKINVMINPNRHLLRYFHKAEELGQSLDVAIIFGAHPAVWLEGAMPDGLVNDDMDELNIASSLSGSPIELIKGKTIDLAYPANCEIVIEGRMINGDREDEGPFGDYSGIYDNPPRKNPVIEISAIANLFARLNSS